MKLIVGLGNPGEEYTKTRHNMGAMVLNNKIKIWSEDKYANALISRQSFETETESSDRVEFLRPLTFMNNSGMSVAYIVKKNNLKSKDLIVIHDDMDLPLGEVKIKMGGSSAGHRGVESIIYHLGTSDFWRIRVGIAPHLSELIVKRNTNAAGFVLSPFHPDEQSLADKVIDMVSSHLGEWINDLGEKCLKIKMN